VHASLAPLDSLLDRALARNPDERFASAEEFARAIEDVAPMVGGVAPHAVVAKLVGRLAQHKLEAERARMQSAAACLEGDCDERSETRKLTRADGIGPDAPSRDATAEHVGWRSALSEMTLPRWLGVGLALLLGALCTALFPAPAVPVHRPAAGAAVHAIQAAEHGVPGLMRIPFRPGGPR
jgi:hypothetical protein